jgi:hypothetical protein
MDEPKTTRWVTNEELKDELSKLPSRWEVRFLILAGMIAAQVVPAADIARAAVGILP